MSAPIIDVNVTLARWPTRRLPHDDTPALVKLLRSRGITQAWAGTFDGLLHKDLASANARLADDCAKHGDGVLLPFGSVNPKLPDWEEDLRRCVEDHGMRGIRLHPNYHGYELTDAVFVHVLQMAAERKMLVQIVASMEDDRMMHPLMRVPQVDIVPLPEALAQAPGTRVVLLNASRAVPAPVLPKIFGAGEVYFDFAMLEGVGGIANQLQHMHIERLLFGSHAPMLYIDSAILKLRESDLTDDQRNIICHGNAERLMAN
ncbi:MAG: amidohydrolase family protein [Candidatus Hydrogenedentes bacterium]|nr:amidohydrolase family protein [Candidatus Hydrogenedentota bacterium]